MDHNATLQGDEVETLGAIYGEDFRHQPQNPRVYSVSVATPDESHRLWIQITYPQGYPTSCPPVYELRGSEWLGDADILNIDKEFTQIHKDHEGETVVYQWIECIRDYIANVQVKQETMSAKTTHGERSNSPTPEEGVPHTTSSLQTPFPAPLLQSGSPGDGSGQQREREIARDCPVILHGEPLTDRRSTFQAHAAVITSKEEADVVVTELKRNKKIASATHNIVAYRLLDVARGGVLVQDCDDDGESAAGGRLLHLLQMMNVMNTVVVVSRWYGGILLHGDRFKHINNVARTLLQETGIGLEKKEATSPAKGASRNKGKRTKH